MSLITKSYNMKFLSALKLLWRDFFFRHNYCGIKIIIVQQYKREQIYYVTTFN